MHGSQIAAFARRLQEGARQLEAQFLGKEETVRLLFVSAIAGEHLVMVGPPGTAKSALLRAFSQVIEAQYFNYLLTRFTEPNEIFGPVDIQAFRHRLLSPARWRACCPRPRSSSSTRSSRPTAPSSTALLTLLNSRRYTHGNEIDSGCPLISMYRGQQRGAQRRRPVGALRPLLAARAGGLPRQLPLPGSAPKRASISKTNSMNPDAKELSPVISASDLRSKSSAALAQLLALWRGLSRDLQGPGVPDPLRGRSACPIAAS